MAGYRPGATASVPKFGAGIGAFVADRLSTEWLFFGHDQEEAHPSRILRDHSEGLKLGELYDQMLEYPVIAGLWEKRHKAVTGLPWEIVPADNTPLAQEIADKAQLALSSIKKLDTNLVHQLGGIPCGLAVDESLWDQRGTGPLAGLWVPTEIVDRPMHRFGFKIGDPRLYVRDREGQLIAVDQRRFLVTRHGSKDQPWGRALLDAAYWYYYIALHNFKYWPVANEKWAQPTVVVRYNRESSSTGEGSTASQQLINDALAAASSIQTEYAIAMPKDLDLEFKEAMRSGSASYELMDAALNRAFALLFLGEIDTSGLGKGQGSYAKSRVSNDVRLETIRMDARELADSLTDQLLSVFTRVNYGADAPVPYWDFDVEEAEDREQRQKGAENVLNAGLPLGERDYYRVNQQRKPEPGERMVMRAAAATPSGQPASPAAMAAAWDEQEFAA